MATMSMPTAVNTPATLPVLEKNPPLVVAGASTSSVGAGGAVGVMVTVLSWPVTVVTDIKGVGVHEDEVENVESLDEVRIVEGTPFVDKAAGGLEVDSFNGVDGAADEIAEIDVVKVVDSGEDEVNDGSDEVVGSGVEEGV
ncbi:hypothetical protein MMC20_003409 [Loxospora ochrophaea]|nr:hypothetical protein [Loxospora ochrophaea]